MTKKLDQLWKQVLSKKLGQPVDEEELVKQEKGCCNDEEADSKEAVSRYYLGNAFPDIYLTNREADCSVLLMRFLRCPDIARLLGLSVRTVEFYVNNVKTKLGVRRREDLLFLLNQSDLLKRYVN